jgi:hypothetical protein
MDYTQDPDCIAAYLFQTGIGTTAYDASPHGYNATFASSGHPAWSTNVPVRSYLAYSAAFDGITDNITASSFNTLYHDVDIVFWVYLPTTSEQGCFINIGYPGDPGTGQGFGIGVGSGTFENPVNAGNELVVLFNYVRWIDAHSFGSAGWHWVEVSLDSNGYPHVSIDNTSYYSDNYGPCGNPLSYEVEIGGYKTVGGTYDRFPHCQITELGIFSRNLLTAEKTDIFTNGLKQAPTPPPSTYSALDLAGD